MKAKSLGKLCSGQHALVIAMENDRFEGATRLIREDQAPIFPSESCCEALLRLSSSVQAQNFNDRVGQRYCSPTALSLRLSGSQFTLLSLLFYAGKKALNRLAEEFGGRSRT